MGLVVREYSNPVRQRNGAPFQAVVSFDLHDNDNPRHIDKCIEWLDTAGIQATFFIPTRMLLDEKYAPALRTLAQSRHELGTHSHHHDGQEIEALEHGTGSLGFLQLSTDQFADRFGYAPRVFRSPAWCRMGPAALDELQRLGYHVDASVTPQRLGVLSSRIWQSPHLLAPRRPYFVRRSLLEVPTSCLFVPLGSPTFVTFRELGSKAFARLLMLEARLLRSRVVVAQFHVDDVVGEGRLPGWSRREWRHLLPSRHGIVARYWIRMTDADAVSRLSREVIGLLARGQLMKLDDIYAETLAARGS